jgi:hypothetical protein
VKRFVVFLVPFAAIVTIGIAAKVITSGEAIKRGTPVDMDWGDLGEDVPFVRVRGTAHYPVVIRQRVPGNLLVEERELFLFPLFDASDTSGRGIRVLVRTEREPDNLVSFETMTLEGYVSVPTPENVPFETEIALGKRSDYFFTDGMLLLEPWKVEVKDEDTWELSD